MIFISIGVLALGVLAIYFGYKIGKLPETFLWIMAGVILAIALPVIAHAFYADHPLVLAIDWIVTR